MRRQSGICVELNQDRSIFLIENGRFIKGAPAGNPSLGEETFFYPYEKTPAVRWQPIMAPVIAAASAFVLFMSVLVSPAKEAFGYVQVQINPGVELGINDQYEVISIRELNSDGHELIHQLEDWENDSLLDVMGRVFELAVTEQTEQITITAVEEEDDDFDKAIKKVVLAVSSDTKNKQMAIQMKEATMAQWRQSKEDRVPVGQLIKKTETLEIQQQSDVQKSNEEKEPVTDPKENKAVKEQNQLKKNNDKEPKNIKPTEENKTIPPGLEKKAVPPAAEKKQGNPSPKTEQQKTPKQNRKTEEPAAKTEKAPPLKAQEKVKPNKPVTKEKPLEKKEKNPSVNKEKNPSENKAQTNNKAPGQQNKSDKPAASSNSIHKTESQPSVDPGKKDGQAPDHSRKDERQGQKGNGNTSNPQTKQGNKAKE